MTFREVLKRKGLAGFATALAGLCLSSASNAAAVNLDTWYTFNFGAVNSSLFAGVASAIDPPSLPSDIAPNGPWQFTLAAPGTFFIIDMGLSGDQFSLVNGLTSLGLTSAPVVGGECALNLTCALNDSKFSRASFALAADSYSITGTAQLSPFGGGIGAFRISSVPPSVPEPGTLALLGLGLLGLGLSRRRKV